MARDNEELMVDTQEHLQSVSDRYVQWSNQEYGELTKQITVFVSILMPLTVMFLTSEDFARQGDFLTAKFAFIMIVSFSTTLLIGSASYVINGIFWKRGAEKVSEAMDKLAALDPDEEDGDYIAMLYEDAFNEEDSGYDWLFNIAVFSFLTGIVCFIIVMYRALL